MNLHGGWTKTPNNIYNAIPEMGTAELLCTLILVRETYGYHCRQVRMTYQDFMDATGIRSRTTISSALKKVEGRGFFKRTADPSIWRVVDLAAPVEEYSR